MTTVTIVGAGLAGTEAAYQLARRGHSVRLMEMKPHKRTPAQCSDGLAELVCSNSMRGLALTNAVGLLKEELRLSGSLIIECAIACRVPAGGALAVDRERFSAMVGERIAAEPNIEVVHQEVERIPDERPTIIATGPLTSDALANHVAEVVGAEHLAYYDAIAPIIAADSIDETIAWRQSRYDKGSADYLNCPMDEEQYQAFIAAMVAAEQVAPKTFEDVRYFEGCLPCEVMAVRGEQTLRYGPMKPVGLTNPRTQKRPYAVLQLRAEDAACTAYNMVGFQSRMKWPEQKRIFRMIPGLQNAEFLRMGAIHRNTFIQAPTLLDETMQLKPMPGVYIAGQMAGVEGYVESTAAGLVCAVMLSQTLRGQSPTPPPATTAFGGLMTHLGREHERLGYQPSNITWAHVPALPQVGKKVRKRERYAKLSERALEDLAPWLEAIESLPAVGDGPIVPSLDPEPTEAITAAATGATCQHDDPSGTPS